MDISIPAKLSSCPFVAHPSIYAQPQAAVYHCTVTYSDIGLLSITIDSFEVPRLLQKWRHAVWTLFDLASFTEHNGAEINWFCIYQWFAPFWFWTPSILYSLTFLKPFFQTCQLYLVGGSARASSLPYFQTQKFHLNVLRKKISSKTSWWPLWGKWMRHA